MRTLTIFIFLALCSFAFNNWAIFAIPFAIWLAYVISLFAEAIKNAGKITDTQIQYIKDNPELYCVQAKTFNEKCTVQCSRCKESIRLIKQDEPVTFMQTFKLLWKHNGPQSNQEN